MDYDYKSKNILYELHPYLQLVFSTAIKTYPHKLVCGYRGEKLQNEAYDRGASKVKFPKSKHNKKPSRAVDAAPTPIDYSDDPKNIARFYHFAGYVLAVGEMLCVPLRCGVDWDKDKDFTDQSFDDLQHFELI